MSPLIPKPTTGAGKVVELVVIVALAVGLALLIQAFIVKPYRIPSGRWSRRWTSGSECS